MRKEDEKDVDALKTFITLMVSLKAHRFFDSIAHFLFYISFFFTEPQMDTAMVERAARVRVKRLLML